MSNLIDPGPQNPSDEFLLALSTAAVVVRPVENPYVLAEMGRLDPLSVTEDVTDRALRELVARYREDITSWFVILDGKATMLLAIMDADTLILTVAVHVLSEHRRFVVSLREAVVKELLRRAPVSVRVMIAIAEDRKRHSVARAVRLMTQWSPTEQALFLLHARERGVAEALTTKDGYLSSSHLATLFGMTPGQVATMVSRLTRALREAAKDNR